MRANKTLQWVEGYLYRARGHRALEQSVLAEGGRHGFSERRLRQAGRSLGVSMSADCWELPALRAEALDARSLLGLGTILAPARSLPTVQALETGSEAQSPFRVRRVA